MYSSFSHPLVPSCIIQFSFKPEREHWYNHGSNIHVTITTIKMGWGGDEKFKKGGFMYTNG